jgi:putative ABC transport system substrate-binding protein
LFHSQEWVLKGLGDRGYVDGRNIVIEYRYAAGKAEQLPSLAAELAALHVDLIVAVGTPAARAAIAATKTIPIIFCRIGDPVGYGLVASLAHPGGNATGVTVFTVELAEKRIEVLKDQVPGLDRLAVIHDPTFPPGQIELKQITAAASALKIQVHAVPLREPSALEAAFPDVMRQAPQALFVGSAAWFVDKPQQIVDFALRTRLPALYVRREYAEIGGIISYGIPFRDMYRDAANYIDRVLKGAKPSDLPVLQPTRIELVINLKSARALGLTIAPPLVARADDVIE